MGNAGFLLAAYGLVWTVLLAYTVYLIRMHRQLQKKIDSLKEAAPMDEEPES